jgi:hypothetical protein
VHGIDRHLRDLLEAAVGEPPHRVTAEIVRRRVIKRRVVECTAIAVAVAVIAAIIPVGLAALNRRPGPPASIAMARIFTSRQYGYTEALPAGWWSNRPATQRWDGNGAPADRSSVVDLFAGPGGVKAWVYAAPTKENLAAYAITTARAAATAHPCQAVPQTNQAITISGAPARVLAMQCPPGSRFLVEIAVTILNGTAFVFSSQYSSAPAPGDRAAFRKFLAGIQFRR